MIDANAVSRIEAHIGYQFRNQAWLQIALSRKMFEGTYPADDASREKLQGSNIVQDELAAILKEDHPDTDAKKYKQERTEAKQLLLSPQGMAEACHRLDVAAHSKQVQDMSPKLLRALAGAIYRDSEPQQALANVRSFLRRFFAEELASPTLMGSKIDIKGQMEAACRRLEFPIPSINVSPLQSDSHYHAHLFIGDVRFDSAGRSEVDATTGLYNKTLKALDSAYPKNKKPDKSDPYNTLRNNALDRTGLQSLCDHHQLSSPAVSLTLIASSVAAGNMYRLKVNIDGVTGYEGVGENPIEMMAQAVGHFSAAIKRKSGRKAVVASTAIIAKSSNEPDSLEVAAPIVTSAMLSKADPWTMLTQLCDANELAEPKVRYFHDEDADAEPGKRCTAIVDIKYNKRNSLSASGLAADEEKALAIASSKAIDELDRKLGTGATF